MCLSQQTFLPGTLGFQEQLPRAPWRVCLCEPMWTGLSKDRIAEYRCSAGNGRALEGTCKDTETGASR